jgi:hypothetical protein
VATILVAYDLNSPGQKYDKLIAALKEYGTWMHHLDSTWLIRTESTTQEVHSNLRQHLDGDDELLVVNVSGDARTWSGFNEEGSSWIKDTWT